MCSSDLLRCTVNNCFYLADIGLPGSVGFTVRVGNCLSENNALSADAAFCHNDTSLSARLRSYVNEIVNKLTSHPSGMGTGNATCSSRPQTAWRHSCYLLYHTSKKNARLFENFFEKISFYSADASRGAFSTTPKTGRPMGSDSSSSHP